MPASKEYQCCLIAPGATAGVSIHGYPDNMATAFSAVVYPILVEALHPQGGSKIELTQIESAGRSGGT
jgi:hypothetical protein